MNGEIDIESQYLDSIKSQLERLAGTKDESYPGNMGVIEMTRFYEKATPQEASAMRVIVREKNWENYKKLIKRVLGEELC